MIIRKEVAAFCRLMANKLEKHAAVRGDSWKEMSAESLLGRVYDCGAELAAKLAQLRTLERERQTEAAKGMRVELALEAANAGNYAMMIADVIGGLPEPVPLRSTADN